MASSLTYGKDSDVLVIGGGPAGTSAAITCAEAGRFVILLEAASFPRHAPGETLHPGVEPLLQRLGVEQELEQAAFLRHPGVWVNRSGKAEFHAYGSDARGPWLGYQAWRPEFDALLLERARRAGVRILQPHRAVRVLREGDRVVGAETTAGSLAAGVVIDASGASGWLARQLASPYQRVSPRLTALYGYVEGECPARDEAPSFRLTPDGWTWTARVRTGVYQWTRVVTCNPRQSMGPFHMGPPLELAGLRRLGRTRGSDVTWRRLSTFSGPGYFVAGDAACVCDPSSSHGVLRALMSGMLAGHLVSRRTGRERPEALSRQYERFLGSWFKFDRAQIEKLTEFSKWCDIQSGHG